MRHAGQRKHIVSQLSTVGYELLVFAFLLRPSVLSFVTRGVAQFAATHPVALAPGRSLGLWLVMLSVLHTQTFLNLLFPPSESKGLVLDFIGNEHLPPRLLLLVVDTLLLTVQVVEMCITFEIATTAQTLSGASVLDAEPDTDAVLRLDLRGTVKRILHPPPLSELPAPALANEARRRRHLTALLRNMMARQLPDHARS